MYIYGYIGKNVINEDEAIDGIVNPNRKDVVDCSCIDFRSETKVKMARGILKFYENIPENKAKATSMRSKARSLERICHTDYTDLLR